MSTSKRRGGLRKRITDDTFVQVPSKTVNDYTVSYRALGVLSWLLEKPDGWDVRAEQIAGQGKKGENDPEESEREGVGAIRTALNELAKAGYYRLERCRMLDGKFEMSTAVSKTPVERWAQQARYFEGKGGVPLIQQEDLSFLVKYPDGTLLPDDFPPPVADSDDMNTETGPQFSGPGIPATGNPHSGNLGALTRRSSDSDLQDSVPASQVRPGEPRRRNRDSEQPPLDDALPEGAPKVETPNDRACGIGRRWMEHRAKKGAPIAGTRVLVQLRSLILPFIEAGYSDDEIRWAMAKADEAIPSKPRLQREVEIVRNAREESRGKFGDRRSQVGPATGINRHVDDLTAEEREDRNFFRGAARSSEVTTGMTSASGMEDVA